MARASSRRTSSARTSTRRTARPRRTSPASRPTTRRARSRSRSSSPAVSSRSSSRCSSAASFLVTRRSRTRRRTRPRASARSRSRRSKTGRSFVMERNENYPEIEGLPAAKLDKITINSVTNDSRAITDVLQNKADYYDEPPSSDALREFRQKAPDRYRGETTNSTYYYFLNTRVKPFDDVKVRQAVNFAVDKRALQRLFGGLLTPSCNFLPPGMQGFQKIDPVPVRRSDGRRRTSRRPSSSSRRPARRARASPSTATTRSSRRNRHGVPRQRPLADRAQAPAADRQRRRVLPDDRQPGHEGRSGLRELVPGLSPPVRTSCS